MTTQSFCSKCGNALDANSQFCPKCGAPIGSNATAVIVNAGPISQKSGLLAFLLCLFLGTLGIHRFYVGKIGTGILMLLTGGGFGLWYLYDLINIVCNNFRDSNGNVLEITRNPSTAKIVLMVLGSLFAAFLLFVFTLFGLIIYLTSGLTDVAEDQLTALRAGNIEKAYTYTSKDFQKNTSYEGFKQFIDNNSSLKNNVDASFTNRSMNDDDGTLIGTLKAKDGSVTSVKIIFKKENAIWKIQRIDINPTDSDEINTSHTSLNTTLPNVFENKNYHYSIKYPSGWEYTQPTLQTVAFNWKDGNGSVSTVINLQVLPSKQIGGIYSNPEDVVTDLKKQYADKASDVKLIDSSKVDLPQNPNKFHGEYFVVTYTYKGQAMKKMQYVMTSDDSKYIYSWGYTSNADTFAMDLPIAKAMYNSWVIE